MSWNFEVYQLLTEERIRECHREALKPSMAAQAAPQRDRVQEVLAHVLYGVFRRVIPEGRRAPACSECAAREPFL
jgi:hypothetical protein